MGIKQNHLDLAKFIVDDFADFDPAHPDPIESVDVPPSPSNGGGRGGPGGPAGSGRGGRRGGNPATGPASTTGVPAGDPGPGPL